MSPQQILVELTDLNPEAILLDNMAAALVGLGSACNNEPVAVYSQAKIFAQLTADGFSQEEAAAYFQERLAEHTHSPHAPVILLDFYED
jgi:hypothetical protein